MFHGVLALLTRSLRQDARQLRNHVFRLSFVAFIYIALLYGSLTAGMFGAPGLQFFRTIAWLNAVFITCAGIGFFASAISEEKEEETIGLLMMAGLNPLGILLGKSTSRLIQASMLLIVQFPFMLLAVTLGGVTPHQILAAYAALLAFMVLLANMALVWSTVCERGGSAAGLTSLCLVLYGVMPAVAPVIATELKRRGLTTATYGARLLFDTLAGCEKSSLYWRLGTIMTTGFSEPVFSLQTTSNLVGGVVCFVAAWALFVPYNSHTTGGNVSRGLVLNSGTRLRLLSPGRSWAAPLAWKDFQFIAGGYGFAMVKVFAYAVLFVAVTYVSRIWNVGATWNDIGPLYVMCLSWGVAIEACILAARIFHDEVRLQTLSSLLMLPRSIAYLGYTKTLGCLMGLAPSIGCLCLGTLMLPGIDVTRALEVMSAPYVWGVILVFAVFLHLVALLSLFVRWGALPLAIVVMAPMMTCCPVLQLLVLVVGRHEMHDTFSALAATAVVWVLMALVCFVFQMMIAARLQEIGAK